MYTMTVLFTLQLDYHLAPHLLSDHQSASLCAAGIKKIYIYI